MIRFMTGDWSKVPDYLKEQAQGTRILGDATMTEKQLIQLGRSLLDFQSVPGVNIVVFTNIEAVFLGLRLEVKKRHYMGSIYFDHYHEDGTVSNPHIRVNGNMTSWPPGFFEETEKALRELHEFGIH